MRLQLVLVGQFFQLVNGVQRVPWRQRIRINLCQLLVQRVVIARDTKRQLCLRALADVMLLGFQNWRWRSLKPNLTNQRGVPRVIPMSLQHLVDLYENDFARPG